MSDSTIVVRADWRRVAWWVPAMFAFGLVAFGPLVLSGALREGWPAAFLIAALFALGGAVLLVLHVSIYTIEVSARGVRLVGDGKQKTPVTLAWRDVVSVESETETYLRVGGRAASGRLPVDLARRSTFVAGVLRHAPTGNALRRLVERAARTPDGGLRDPAEPLAAPVLVRVPLGWAFAPLPAWFAVMTLVFGSLLVYEGRGPLDAFASSAAISVLAMGFISLLVLAYVFTCPVRIGASRIACPDPTDMQARSVAWEEIEGMSRKRFFGSAYVVATGRAFPRGLWIPAPLERDPAFVAAVKRHAPTDNPLRVHVETVARASR